MAYLGQAKGEESVELKKAPVSRAESFEEMVAEVQEILAEAK